MGVMTESDPNHTMNREDSTHNCAKSNKQRTTVDIVKEIIDETISEKLDTTIISSTSNTFCVADMGCSVGPNTFYSVQFIIEAVKRKFITQGLTSDHQMPQFQVLFNDLPSSDFNALFKSLPPDREYFSAGVPGSFHGRLFPDFSLHFVVSSYALQWLSQVPQRVLDIDSPAWNKGRVHYTSAPEAVVEAYATQYAEDMEKFLDARAEELVAGGMLLLIMPSMPDGIPHSNAPTGVLFNVLGSCLMDMVKEELVCEDLLDSFNIPMYSVSPKEIKKIIERNGCFTIERMEPTSCRCDPNDPPTGYAIMTNIRSGTEAIFTKHFGDEITDELFYRFQHKITEFMQLITSSNPEVTQLTVFLKRR